MSAAKPKPYASFEELTKKLLAVPKSELDKQVDHYNARKLARKKAPKKRK